MLIEARLFLDRALSMTRSRADERAIGERIVAVIELEELQECRVLAEIRQLDRTSLDVAAD